MDETSLILVQNRTFWALIRTPGARYLRPGYRLLLRGILVDFRKSAELRGICGNPVWLKHVRFNSPKRVEPDALPASPEVFLTRFAPWGLRDYSSPAHPLESC